MYMPQTKRITDSHISTCIHTHLHTAAAAAKSLQSCPTLCDPIEPTRLPHPWDSPGKNAGVGCHFLLQCMKGKVKVKLLSHVRLFATPWTVAYQAPPYMGFSRQEYRSGLPFPSPWDLPGIEPRSPALQADTLTSEPPGKQQQIRTYTERATGGCQGFCRGLRGKVAQVAKNPPANAEM